MEEKKYLTVGALTKYIKYKFDNDIHLNSVLLEGEISNFKRHSRGHFYFTIKDSEAQISATMFSFEASKVNFEPKDGMTVLVCGNISVYMPQGSYQININKMEQKGVGNLFLAYEALKKELENLGYFDNLHKKRIPLYPKAIAVITSPTGAAVKDCINTIKRRYPLAQIYVYPALVQGDGAKDSIVKNILQCNKDNLVDTIILGRGGGSIEDLWAFNEKIVADAIYNSKIPIISAVGHETDFTICDFVSDIRAATPTAAAEIATPDLNVLKQTVKIFNQRMNNNISNKLNNIKSNLVHLDSRIDSASPSKLLDKLNERKLFLDKQLSSNFNMIVMSKKHTLSLCVDKLKVLNPLLIMEKGFSVSSVNDKIIRSVNDVNLDDLITVELSNGKINAKVVDIYGR